MPLYVLWAASDACIMVVYAASEDLAIAWTEINGNSELDFGGTDGWIDVFDSHERLLETYGEKTVSDWSLEDPTYFPVLEDEKQFLDMLVAANVEPLHDRWGDPIPSDRPREIRELADANLPDGVRLDARGARRLLDYADREVLEQLVHRLPVDAMLQHSRREIRELGIMHLREHAKAAGT